MVNTYFEFLHKLDLKIRFDLKIMVFAFKIIFKDFSIENEKNIKKENEYTTSYIYVKPNLLKSLFFLYLIYAQKLNLNAIKLYQTPNKDSHNDICKIISLVNNSNTLSTCKISHISTLH